MLRVLTLVLTLLIAALPAAASAAGDVQIALPVPYRTQLDGNPYELADCGPATMAMIVTAYGHPVKTIEVRRLVNKIQGTEGEYDAGSFLESLWTVAERYGLKPMDLFSGEKNDKGEPLLRRWSMEDLKRHLDAGRPIVPQGWYRGLPGRERNPYWGAHYITVTGYTSQGVIYNDPIDKDGPGANRMMSWAQFDKAWRNSDFPYAGFAVAGPAERPSLLSRPAPKPTPSPTAAGGLRPVIAAPVPGPGDMPLASYPGTFYVVTE